MATDTLTSLARNNANVFYSPKWLDYSTKNLVYQQFGMKIDLAQRSGNMIHLKAVVPPEVAENPAPLVEGVTPSPVNLSRREVATQILQLGDWLQETDQMRDLFEDANNLTDWQNEHLGEIRVLKRDRIAFNVLKAGSNVVYAGSGVSARSSVNTPISNGLLKKVSRILKNGVNGRAGKPIKRILKADNRFGTVSIEPSFVAIIHPDLESDVRDLAGFAPVADYGTTSDTMIGEFGKVDNFRFVCTTTMFPFRDSGGAAAGNNVKSTTGTSADVYPIIFLAQDAYAIVPLMGKDGARLIRKSLGEGGEDPLDQRGTVGYKDYFAVVITHQERMCRGEVAATDELV